jgi:hypothetical protein
VESLSQRQPGVAAELGAHHAIVQLPAGHPQGDLYDQQRGIAKPVTAQDDQNPRGIPQRRSSAEVAISRSSAGSEEVDDADPPLARSLQSLHDAVAGTDACPGKNRVMTTRKVAPHPKNKNWPFTQKIDTPIETSRA